MAVGKCPERTADSVPRAAQTCMVGEDRGQIEAIPILLVTLMARLADT